MARKSKSKGSEAFPTTIDTAVDLVLSRMSDDLKEWMRDCDDETDLRLQMAKRMMGMGTRAILGLWGQNPKLLTHIPKLQQHPDDASAFILLQCWHRLRERPE